MLIPTLLFVQCKQIVEPQAMPSLPKKYSPAAVDAIKVGALRARVVLDQFKVVRTKIPRGETFDYSINEYRKQITDPEEQKMYDEITNHKEFKKLGDYLSKLSNQLLNSNGRTATTFWDEDDYYVSEDAKGWIHGLDSEMRYLFETSLSSQSSSDLLYACYDKLDDFSEALDNKTDLTQYDKDLLWPGVYALYSSLPSLCDEFKSYPPEARVNGWLSNRFGSIILHMFIAVVVITAVVFVIGALTIGAAAITTMLATNATIYIGSAAFSVTSITVGSGLAAGGALGIALAAANQCLTSDQSGVHYESCD